MKYPRFSRRIQAVLIDSLILPVVIISLIFIGGSTGVESALVKGLLIVIPTVILEPGLVSFTGGTIGHHLLKIKVRKQDKDQNIGFFFALARFFIKLLLGWISLIWVLVTRRHQALHDIVGGSVVVFKNPETVPSYEVLSERVVEEDGYISPSWWRRCIAIVVYFYLFAIIMGVIFVTLYSNACLEYDICSSTDKGVDKLHGLSLIVIFGAVVTLGWKGRLFGARRKVKALAK